MHLYFVVDGQFAKTEACSRPVLTYVDGGHLAITVRFLLNRTTSRYPNTTHQ